MVAEPIIDDEDLAIPQAGAAEPGTSAANAVPSRAIGHESTGASTSSAIPSRAIGRESTGASGPTSTPAPTSSRATGDSAAFRSPSANDSGAIPSHTSAGESTGASRGPNASGVVAVHGAGPLEASSSRSSARGESGSIASITASAAGSLASRVPGDSALFAADRFAPATADASPFVHGPTGGPAPFSADAFAPAPPHASAAGASDAASFPADAFAQGAPDALADAASDAASFSADAFAVGAASAGAASAADAAARQPLPGGRDVAARAAGESGDTSSSAARDLAVASPRPGSGPNPFDDQVWRSEGGSDSEADAVGVHPIVGRRARLLGAVTAFFRQRRNLAIVAGAGVLLIAVIGIAASGGSSESSESADEAADTAAVAKTETIETPPTGPTEPVPAESRAGDDTSGVTANGGAGAGTATDTGTGVGAGADDDAAELAATELAATDGAATGIDELATEAAPREPAPRKVRRAPTIAGKRIVLEYDNQAREAKPITNAPQRDVDAISRARTSYAAGNTRLFAGDADGAIRNYRQALAYYPAYVAGYRGLGLAYAQKGDKAKAIRALRTYLSTVPRAKDAALIRKRIQMLR